MTDRLVQVRRHVEESVRVHQAVGEELAPLLVEVASRMTDLFRAGHHVYFMGNGGSAADAQHWAAELSGRFYLDRPSLPATALTTNTSQITAIANDYAYAEIFSRPLSGLLKPGDMVVGISTSGNSASVVQALEVARRRQAVTIGFTGASGGAMKALCDYCICIPSTDVARIQEGHELCAHILCALIEDALFGPAAVAERRSASEGDGWQDAPAGTPS